jgi:hypothetical protein
MLCKVHSLRTNMVLSWCRVVQYATRAWPSWCMVRKHDHGSTPINMFVTCFRRFVNTPLLVVFVVGCKRIGPRLPDRERDWGISLGEIIDCSAGSISGMEMERPKHPVNYFINRLYSTTWAVNTYMRTVQNFVFAVLSNIKYYFSHILR